MRKFESVLKLGQQWQKSGDWTPHTCTKERSQLLARGYLDFIKMMTGWTPNAGCDKGLDIGAGAGYVANALSMNGNFEMIASEWSNDGVELIHKHNPELRTRILDIMSFDDKGEWDFIICRELYPFTRVNSFSDQYEIISHVIDALKPGGIFLLIGSDVSFPHCADYNLLLQSFRKDSRVEFVSKPYLEAILLRLHLFSYFDRL